VQNDLNAQICYVCGWQVPIPIAVPVAQQKRKNTYKFIWVIGIVVFVGLGAMGLLIRANRASSSNHFGATSSPTPTPITGPVLGVRKAKIYLRPDCPGYSKVSARNRVTFETEAEAQAAGYRKAPKCP
jgi:hypothetical protein